MTHTGIISLFLVSTLYVVISGLSGSVVTVTAIGFGECDANRKKFQRFQDRRRTTEKEGVGLLVSRSIKRERMFAFPSFLRASMRHRFRLGVVRNR